MSLRTDVIDIRARTRAASEELALKVMGGSITNAGDLAVLGVVQELLRTIEVRLTDALEKDSHERGT